MSEPETAGDAVLAELPDCLSLRAALSEDAEGPGEGSLMATFFAGLFVCSGEEGAARFDDALATNFCLISSALGARGSETDERAERGSSGKSILDFVAGEFGGIVDFDGFSAGNSSGLTDEGTGHESSIGSLVDSGELGLESAEEEAGLGGSDTSRPCSLRASNFCWNSASCNIRSATFSL